MQVIPIASAAAPSGGCDEGSGEVPRLNLPLARREFLKGSGILVGTIASGSMLAALAPSPVWAVELKTLSKVEGQTLMKMGRVLYPHKQLPDTVYALLAKDLDPKASADAAAATQLREGVAALDNAAGGSFAKASDKKKLEIVKAMEGQPFFARARPGRRAATSRAGFRT